VLGHFVHQRVAPERPCSRWKPRAKISSVRVASDSHPPRVRPTLTASAAYEVTTLLPVRAAQRVTHRKRQESVHETRTRQITKRKPRESICRLEKNREDQDPRTDDDVGNEEEHEEGATVGGLVSNKLSRTNTTRNSKHLQKKIERR